MTHFETEPTIYVVDDDDAVRDSLAELMDSVGHQVETYPSATAFLNQLNPDRPGALILDIRMPGMSGLELQDHLNQRNIALPIIFVTGHGDVPMAVQAMQHGAAEFLQKPFRDQDLLDRIEHALARDAERRSATDERRQIQQRIDVLTDREREVLEMIVTGKANKVIAIDLGISQRTVEIHRARVMEKMQVGTLAELVTAVLKIRCNRADSDVLNYTLEGTNQ